MGGLAAGVVGEPGFHHAHEGGRDAGGEGVGGNRAGSRDGDGHVIIRVGEGDGKVVNGEVAIATSLDENGGGGEVEHLPGGETEIPNDDLNAVGVNPTQGKREGKVDVEKVDVRGAGVTAGHGRGRVGHGGGNGISRVGCR